MATFTSSKFQPLDNDKLMAIAPSIFASEAHESRGDRYKFIPTIEVVEALRNEGFFPVFATQSRSRIPGKREFTKHMIRFRQDKDLAKGELFAETVLTNSHDGTSSYILDAGIMRLACLNGMVCDQQSIENIKVRHSGDIINSVIEGTFRIVDAMPAVLDQVEQMSALHLTGPEKEMFANAALSLRWDAEDENVRVSPADLLRPRRYADTGSDLWTTMNVVQEKLIRGGVRVWKRDPESHTVTHRTAKAITGVTENVKLNKAIWALSAAFADLKAA